MVHQCIFSKLAMNLACNCQFDAKISPLHILIGLTLPSICLSLPSRVSHAMPCHARLNLHFTRGTVCLLWGTSFHLFSHSAVGQECRLRDMLLSIYKAECMALQQHQLLGYSSSSVSWAEWYHSISLLSTSEHLEIVIYFTQGRHSEILRGLVQMYLTVQWHVLSILCPFMM